MYQCAMRFPASLLMLVATAFAQSILSTNFSSLGPDTNGKYEISADGIRGLFIPYGASITNLFVTGKDGREHDVVLGFDNASTYEGPVHPHLGGVPGRYANRIRNSSFLIDGSEYHVLPNENNRNNTLHGGPDGWDYRNFSIVAHTKNSITFSIVDPDGKEGFPGEVVSYVTYTMTKNTWTIKMIALATTKKTPIMLTSHVYWNLDGFANPDDATVLSHVLYTPYSGQRVSVDGILVPDGTILPNKKYSVNDFWSAPKKIGANLTAPELYGNCGTNCTGYDNCYLVNRSHNRPINWHTPGPVASLSSAWSGIKLDVFTDQEAFQVYSCGGQDGTLPIKYTQGLKGRAAFVPQYGCIVMEVQDWIDAINHPEWQREKRHIFGPADPAFTLEADYVFSTTS